MSALLAVVRPDGLEAIVGADDAAWLAAEARKAKERVERYDGADGAAGLFGEEDASDGGGGVCEGGDGWVEWLDLFFVASAVQWPPAPYLKYHSSIGAIGHGDVVWAAGEELARRILAHEAPFEAVGMGTRVLELGAGCGLPSLAAAHGGADVVATDAPVAGGIIALAATARRMGPTFDGRLRVRRLDWGDPAREGPFDVVLMADIIYAPTAHGKLLATLSGVFEANPKAVAVVAFCLHGNAPDDKVMAFFDRARERGLTATEVDVVQRGASESMRGVILARDLKRARVHTWVLRVMGRIEHELPDGQIKCFTVDRDANSVFLSTSGCWGGCAGGGPCDRFELHFNNMKPQITFMFMGGIYSKPTGHKDPCMGALARTDAKGASLKAGKQYSAGSIRVVSCAKDVSPQYQLTEWLQV